MTDRPILHIKSPPTEWLVERSYLKHVPDNLEANELEDIRLQVQEIADQYNAREPTSLSFGAITFRYETDSNDRASTIHCYFVDRHGNLKRFMRLKRS